MKKIISSLLCVLLISTMSILVDAKTTSNLAKPKFSTKVTYVKKTISDDTSDLVTYLPKVTINIKNYKKGSKYQVYMKTNKAIWLFYKTTTKRKFNIKLLSGNVYRFKIKQVKDKNSSKFSSVKKIKTKEAEYDYTLKYGKTIRDFKNYYESERQSYIRSIDSQIQNYKAQINSLQPYIDRAAIQHQLNISRIQERYADSGLLNSGAYNSAIKSENERYNIQIQGYVRQKSIYNQKISELQEAKSEINVKNYVFEQINKKYDISYETMNDYYNKLYL